jgi:hypothetical protein
MAETEGFEPSIRVSPYNDLANRRLQPLGHVSGSAGSCYRGARTSLQAAARTHRTGLAERRSQWPADCPGDAP